MTLWGYYNEHVDQAKQALSLMPDLQDAEHPETQALVHALLAIAEAIRISSDI